MKKKRTTTGGRQLLKPEKVQSHRPHPVETTQTYRRHEYTIGRDRATDGWFGSFREPARPGDAYRGQHTTKPFPTYEKAEAATHRFIDRLEQIRLEENLQKRRGEPTINDRMAAVQKKVAKWSAEKREQWRRRLNEIVNSEYGTTVHVAAEKAYREMRDKTTNLVCRYGRALKT